MSIVHKTAKKLAIALLTFIALILAAGALYHGLASRLNAQNYPAPGKMVDVGGYKLHVQESGKGSPTVILEAGFACFSLVWNLVQPEIAQFAHVISYDRAGLGWSERGPSPRTSCTMVKELHTLLENMQAPKPYILVGHSFGGVIMQLYANTYPDEAFGLVLVDSSHEQIIERSKEFNRTQYILLPSRFQQKWHSLLHSCGLETVSNITGIRAIYLRSLARSALACIPPSIKDPFLARLLSPTGVYTRGQEMRHISESHLQLARSQNRFSNKPLIVISRGKIIDELVDPKRLWPYLTKAHEEVWANLQNDLVTKSTKSKHIIAPNSGHTIMWSEPELIVDAVRELVDLYQRRPLP